MCEIMYVSKWIESYSLYIPLKYFVAVLVTWLINDDDRLQWNWNVAVINIKCNVENMHPSINKIDKVGFSLTKLKLTLHTMKSLLKNLLKVNQTNQICLVI